MTVFQKTMVRLSEIARSIRAALIRAALDEETRRLQEELSSLQETNAYLQEQAEASAARARRAVRKAWDEAQDEAQRVSEETADRDSERQRLVRDLERARYSGSDYEEQRIIDKLKYL